jgi:hypothetical protein
LIHTAREDDRSFGSSHSTSLDCSAFHPLIVTSSSERLIALCATDIINGVRGFMWRAFDALGIQATKQAVCDLLAPGETLITVTSELVGEIQEGGVRRDISPAKSIV